MKRYSSGTYKLRDRRNIHPTVKPLKLYMWLVEVFSSPGDPLLDPFSGSGTTIIASDMMGRRCIGIEADGKYYEQSVVRARKWHERIMRARRDCGIHKPSGNE